MAEEFIPKDFYIEPPQPNATEDEWKKWLRKETRKQAAHKAAHTRSIAQQDAPDSFFGSVKKVHGVWKQSASFGYADGTSEDSEIVSTEDGSQEKDMILVDMELNRHKRGGSKKGKGARRRRNKRNKKANK